MTVTVNNDGGIAILTQLLIQVNQLQADINALAIAHNTHTHTANGTAVIAGFQTTPAAQTINTKY
jgi:hypothetical protein